MRNRCLATFFAVGLALFLRANVEAAGPTIYPNALKMQSAHLAGGQMGVVWYSGRDTIAGATPVGTSHIDTTGHDTIMNTGWLQIGAFPDSAGTFPNKTLSDSVFHYGVNQLWFWNSMDTSSWCSNATGALNGYHKWVAQVDATARDSVGYHRMWVEFRIVPADSGAARWADSSDVFSYSGGTSDLLYKVWVADRYLMPITTAAQRAEILQKFKVYSLRVPACIQVRIWIEGAKTMKEITIHRWYLVGAHS